MKHEFETRMVETFRREGMALGGDAVLVACSGGPDSTALLLALISRREELGIRLSALTVDHGLRDVKGELEFVQKQCARLGIPWKSISVKVERENGSVQADARRARLDGLIHVAKEVGARAVALGHTRTDQAETVLLHLLRGAGIRGLSGMAPVRSPFVRPLIDLSRESVLSYLHDRGEKWVDDPTNASDVYTRNRLRHQVVPSLEAFAPGAIDRLAKTAGILREDLRALDALAGAAMGRSIIERSAGILKLDCRILKKEPRSLWPHIFGQALKWVRREETDVYSTHLDALCGLAERMDGSMGLDLPGIRVERVYHELIITNLLEHSPENASHAIQEKVFQGPGCYWNENGFITVDRLVRGSVEPSSDELEEMFDASELRFPLILRSPRAGERMSPFGMKGSKLISDVLIDAKVPQKERKRVQVLTSGEDVLWLLGVRRGRCYPLDQATEEVVRVQYIPEKKHAG